MSGRHRIRRRFRGAGATAVAVAVVAVVSGVSLGYQQLAGAGCTSQAKLTVAAAPEIVPAVQSAAASGVEQGGTLGGVCVTVSVTAVDPADVAAALATAHGVGLAGVGQGNGTTVVPDVWVPDSSTWLLRLRTAAPGFVSTDGASIARSPVVVAMPEPVASGLGWPNSTLTWADLLEKITTGTGLRTGIVEPTRDAAGLSGLMALGAAAGTAGANAQEATTATLRAVATGRSALRNDLLAQFPRSSDVGAISSGLRLAMLSEEDVIAYNAAKPPVPLAALYLDPAPTPLDYPFAVMSGTDPAKVAAADGLHQALSTDRFRDKLAAQGLRASDGTWGTGFSAPTGAPSPAGGSPSASPRAGGAAPTRADPAVVDRALSTWSAITAPGRMLAAINVSGTMRGRVPTAGNATRMQVTLQAAQRGLGLFNDDWAVGLWVFSTRLDGAKDYRQLVPIGALSSQRSQLVGALAEIKPEQNRDTGLYDTILAAYKQVQDGWQAGRVNSVVILTDGIGNDDPNGLSLESLISKLNALRDDAQPIQLIILGIGDAVNREPLDQITRTTGGGVLIAEDPARIGDIFLRAIALRPAPR
ncbi:substrate-binding domain-containing protein [Plantactinospora solaniradicis]|uniref:Substrate-binding domain-containing protein n=1 Tax=Plantactinospora solaniradicis TaxID=1723736 RepID=A0ABW1K753_9ACTN